MVVLLRKAPWLDFQQLQSYVYQAPWYKVSEERPQVHEIVGRCIYAGRMSMALQRKPRL